MQSSEIERQIRHYKLTFDQLRDDETEWHSNVPMFIDAYRTALRIYRYIPSQQEFLDEYFRTAKWTKALEARARRVYPSFVRETHLSALLAEAALTVVYERDKDVRDGIDFIIKHNGKDYAIHTFTDTQVSQYARTLKNLRHNFKGTHLDLALNLRTAKRVGDFRLYSSLDVSNLIKRLVWSSMYYCTEYVAKDEDIKSGLFLFLYNSTHPNLCKMVLYQDLRKVIVQSFLNKLTPLSKPAFKWPDYEDEPEYQISKKQYNFLLKLYHASPYDNLDKYLIHMGYKIELVAYRIMTLEFP